MFAALARAWIRAAQERCVPASAPRI